MRAFAPQQHRPRKPASLRPAPSGAAPAGLQARLTVSAPADTYEQEADRVAAQVMRMRDPQPRRACACGGGCPRCRPQQTGPAHAPLQTKRIGPGETGQAPLPLSVHEALRSPGQPLDGTTRAFMEPRFGRDFSHVQVHTDTKARESARAVHALAYTVGRDVVFGSGQYAPGTNEGRKLIAHELSHVAQQCPDERHPSPGTRLQRACGPAEIGSQAGCIGRGGDITNFGGDSGKLFLFRVGCDVLMPGEAARVQELAGTLAPDDHLVIDGFASEEGPAAFNEDLSCARAKALAAALIRAGLSPDSFDGIYMHGATAGARADRRSAVATITGRPQARAPEDCGDLIGSCDFYPCRERQHPCGPGGYYMGYGHKYCERFSRLAPSLSAPGQDWVRQTLRCLQEHIDRHVPIDAPCSTVKQSAFDSHPDCYVRSGVCFLDPNEWLQILGVIDPADNDLKQVLLTGVSCLGNWAPVGLFPQLSLGAGGGYRGLMERDRQRMRRLMQPPRQGR